MDTAELRTLLQAELGHEIVVEEELRRGRTWVVFAATEPRARRSLVVKVVPPAEAAENPTRSARLLRVARQGASLSHPHIVPVYRVAAGDRLCWYVSRREPHSLDDAFEQAWQMDPARVQVIARQIAAALAHAHGRRVVHGDLTPAHVMLDEAGGVHVRDFGVAAAAEIRTRAGGSPLAPHYLAPERWQGGGATEAADQYALAVIIYQMLAGGLPFIGASDEEIRRGHCELPVPSLAASRPDLPPGLAAAVERALAKRPNDRFQSIEIFARALAGGTQKPPAPRPSREAAAPARGRLIRGTGRETPPGSAPSPAPEREPAAARPREPAAARSRELVDAERPQRAPATPPRAPARHGISVPPAAGFALLSMGMLGLWLYLGNAGARDAAPTRIQIDRAILADSLNQARTAAGPSGPLTAATATADPTPAETAATAAPPAATPAATKPAAKPAPRAPVRVPPHPRTPPRTAAAQRAATRANAPKPDRKRVPAGPVGGDIAFITVGSVPLATIYINGQQMSSNPVLDAPVSPGPARIRFVVSDGAGNTWEQNMTVTVRASDTLNLGRLRLEHQQ